MISPSGCAGALPALRKTPNERCPFLLLAVLLAGRSEPPPPVSVPKLLRILIVGAGGTASDATDRSYSGEVRARIETTRGFRVGGKIVEHRADLGMAVKAGQVLKAKNYISASALDARETAFKAADARHSCALWRTEANNANVLRSKQEAEFV